MSTTPADRRARLARMDLGADPYNLDAYHWNALDPDGLARNLADGALRCVERLDVPDERVSRETAQDRIDFLLRNRDVDAELARRVITTGSAAYERAFFKTLAGAVLTDEERTALAIGSGSTGGFAVPIALDPTVIPASNGQLNQLRSIARVETIVGSNEWKGLTSLGITASYAAEATEASDNAPTLVQPAVPVHRAQAFVPFSIEINQDWASLRSEMVRLFADAKDELEADKFVNGTGSGEPQGLVEKLAETAGSIVDSSVYNAFASADVYALEENLPPRFRPLARFVAARPVYNKVRRFDTSGGTDLWVRLDAKMPPELIGYPAYEASAMSGTVAAGEFVLVLGDFRHFLIADRVGMNVELLPHLLGANRRPTGQRGLYAYWRNGSDVLVANAFRILRIEPSS